MRTYCKAIILGGLATGVGIAVYRHRMVRMPFQEFTKYALYMAVMDDEICRNELEGNRIGEKIITFPPKSETLQERYHFYLQANRKRSRRQIQDDITAMEQRLQQSRQYVDRPKQRLKAEFKQHG